MTNGEDIYFSDKRRLRPSGRVKINKNGHGLQVARREINCTNSDPNDIVTVESL